MKYPTPTLNMIRKKQKSGDWKATPLESIDPTSLDQKEVNVLMMASIEMLGLQIEEIKHLMEKQLESQKKEVTPSGITIVSQKPSVTKPLTSKKQKEYKK